MLLKLIKLFCKSVVLPNVFITSKVTQSDKTDKEMVTSTGVAHILLDIPQIGRSTLTKIWFAKTEVQFRRSTDQVQFGTLSEFH